MYVSHNMEVPDWKTNITTSYLYVWLATYVFVYMKASKKYINNQH